jgi:hypothetical protein
VQEALKHYLQFDHENFDLKKIEVLDNKELEEKFYKTYTEFNERVSQEPDWITNPKTTQTTKNLQFKTISHVFLLDSLVLT